MKKELNWKKKELNWKKKERTNPNFWGKKEQEEDTSKNKKAIYH